MDLPEVIIRLREDSIVHVTFKEGITIDVPMQMRLLDSYNEICAGKKLPFLFEAMNHVTIIKEAKENAIKIEHLSPICASAVFVTSLAYRLIAEFYIKIHKPKNPFKIFKTREAAIEWLKQFAK